MIVNKKYVFTKLINKRAEKSYQKKIITKRTSAQDGKRKTKSTFHVSLNENDDADDVWYMRDGNICDGMKSVASDCNSFFYMEKKK